MLYQSPRAEISSLNSLLLTVEDDNSRLIQLLNQKYQEASSAVVAANSQDSNETMGEELIPSPPMSPISSPLCYSRQKDGGNNTTDDQIPPLKVDVVWKSGHSDKLFKRMTMDFLKQYRSFSSGKISFSNTNIHAHRRPAAVKKQLSVLSSSSEFESSGGYRTRGNSKKNSSNTLEHEDESSLETYKKPTISRVSKPTTPIRRGRKSTGVVSASSMHSPLSSLKALQDMTQYIPNRSWIALEDYSPPLTTLPDNDYCLRIEWKGSSMNLSDDPLKDQLHPAEIVLAQILRLPCDLYLDSKRRLFLEKVYRMKEGLTFRRTDAQKACKIDVNKASRLYAAYEKIGWLDDSHFQRYI